MVALPFAALALASAAIHAQARPPYKDPALPVDARVRDLLGRMTLQEKFWQLYMTPGDRDDPSHDWSGGAFGLQIGVRDAKPTRHVPAAGDSAGRNPDRPTLWRTSTEAGAAAQAHAARVNAIQRFFVDSTRLGIPIIPFDEAVHGLMREGATVFPAAIALAATWDSAFVGEAAGVFAAESRTRGIRQVLSPVVNIANDVRWGRVEETFGEDPHLSSVMAQAVVRQFRNAGIITTPKHFVANVGDGGRDSYPIALDARTLEETHFPPFRAAIGVGARSVMTSYNSVNGAPATQNRWLLTDVLRKQWGFSGFVISDAAATGGATVLHFTEPNTPTAAKHAWEAGLDVVFQSTWPQHRPYLQAVEQGLVAPEVIDSAVARVLRAKFELELFEDPYVDAEVAGRVAAAPVFLDRARIAAEKGAVLLRNERNTLPLAAQVRRVAVIGVDAAEARLGGYSATVADPVTVLDALRARLGAASVRYAPGPGRRIVTHVAVPASALARDSAGTLVGGLRGEYWDNPNFSGASRFTRADEAVDFRWTLNSPGRGIPFDWYSVRWTGKIRVPAGGVRRLGVEGNDGWQLWVNGRLVLDQSRKQSFGTRLATVSLAGGTTHDIRLEYRETTGNARVKLVWDAGVRDDSRARIDSAVRIARASQVAVVVAGIEEGEFQDRSTLALPGHQEALIEAVAATGTPTVVVLIGGSAITGGRWIDRVGAVLHAWYPGERGGAAIVRLLYGDANPAGRLPITFPMRDGQLPLTYNHLPTGRGDDYVDGTGMPLFPFGHGLSYTTFSYEALSISPDTLPLVPPRGPGLRAVAPRAPRAFTIRARVRNTGFRTGDEVVQLYVRDLVASVARPVMQLAGFQRITLEPGEARDVTFLLLLDQLAVVGGDAQRVVEPGQFRVMIGASSEDVRLRGTMSVR